MPPTPKARIRLLARSGRAEPGILAPLVLAQAAEIEALPLEAFRQTLEVNVVGQVALTQALLPALRAAGGRIVMVSSVGGRTALPFLGPYHASKFALEGLSDSLRQEVEPLGVRVAIVEPGTIATPIWTKPQPLADALPSEAGERYGVRMERLRALAAAKDAV